MSENSEQDQSRRRAKPPAPWNPWQQAVIDEVHRQIRAVSPLLTGEQLEEVAWRYREYRRLQGKLLLPVEGATCLTAIVLAEVDPEDHGNLGAGWGLRPAE